MKQRNYGIEFFRTICMLAVVMQHVVGFSGTISHGFEMRPWMFGVVGFTLISGYYGISFKVAKLLRLWGIAIVCSLIVAMLSDWYFATTEWLSIKGVLRILGCGGRGGFWYLNAYTVMMLLSPILNVASDAILNSQDAAKRMTAIVAFLVLLCWSWCQELYGVRNFVPHITGVGNLSFLTLVYIYMIGRWLRKANTAIFVDKRCVALAGACLLGTPVVGCFVSPVTIFFTLVVFCHFERMRVMECVGKVVAFMAPSLFSVYLLHTNGFGTDLILRCAAWLMGGGLPRYGMYAILSTLIFIACLVLDVPRRIVAACLNRVLEHINTASPRQSPTTNL